MLFSIASDDEAPLVLSDFGLLTEEPQDVDEADDESVIVLSEYRVAGPELATADWSIG